MSLKLGLAATLAAFMTPDGMIEFRSDSQFRYCGGRHTTGKLRKQMFKNFRRGYLNHCIDRKPEVSRAA